MAKIKIIGKKGSHAVRDIVTNTSITRYKGNTSSVDAIINYGLTGDAILRFFKLYPSAKRIPMLNPHVGMAKLSVVQQAERAGITVPESRLTLPTGSKAKEWIEKRQNSIGGKGIQYASKLRPRIEGKYFQKFIGNRAYELRVHAFTWMDNWTIQKRLGDSDTIAWNYSQGGHFVTVHNNKLNVMKEAIEISKQILDLRHMAFGAVDFLVDSDRNIYFIEINSSPGFQTLSEHIYIDAFNALQQLPSSQIKKYATIY